MAQPLIGQPTPPRFLNLELLHFVTDSGNDPTVVNILYSDI